VLVEDNVPCFSLLHNLQVGPLVLFYLLAITVSVRKKTEGLTETLVKTWISMYGLAPILDSDYSGGCSGPEAETEIGEGRERLSGLI